jgi:hypothetical protein
MRLTPLLLVGCLAPPFPDAVDAPAPPVDPPLVDADDGGEDEAASLTPDPVAPETCDESCAARGWQCGSVCGVSCGGCEGTCALGRCFMQSQSDSCATCMLRLSLATAEVEEGLIQSASFALDYAPGEFPTGPRVADIRLLLGQPGEVVEVLPGSALEDAAKSLTTVVGADATRLVILSSANSNRIGPGRLAEFSVRLETPQPVLSLRIEKTDEIFAPPDSYGPLAGEPYDGEVVVIAPSGSYSARPAATAASPKAPSVAPTNRLTGLWA